MKKSTESIKTESARKAFAHFRRADQVIYEAARKVNFDEWLGKRQRQRNPRNYCVVLAREIVGQQLSGHVAKVIFARFKKLFPSRVVSPTGILRIRDQDLRDTGMAWAKVASLKDLVQKIRNGDLRLKTLHTLADEAVIAELTQVKGIGRWTAEMFLLFTLRREDVFSVGDLGLRKGMQKVYGKKKISDQQAERIAKKWSPFRSFGSIALWNWLDK